MTSVCDVSSRVQIQVLNYTNGEIIDYPFVLLECKVAVLRSQSLHSSTELSDDINDCKRDSIGVVFENDSVLVETGSDCRSWPVVHGGFKALLQLSTGKNIIKLKACINGCYAEQEFSLIYAPSKLKRFVRVVYIKCCDSDGSFQAPPGVIHDVDIATKKLAFNARLLQTFTAQDMNHHGFGHKTFRLDEDSEGTPLISIFTSSITSADALKMTGGQLYDTFAEELTKSSLYSPLCKFWAFMSCTRYEPPSPEEFNDRDIFSYVKAHTALGGGHLALFGTGNLHTWASDVNELVSCFTDTRMIDRRCLFDDSARRGSYWANYATGLGASMHELGHCFDLAHTPGGIMGRGFDDFNCVFSLWKTPPPATRQEPNTEIIEDVQVSSSEDKGGISHKQINNQPVSVKGLVAPPSLQPKKVPESHDNMLVDWMRSNTNCVMPGDWSHGAKWFRSSAVILNHHKWFNDYDDDVNEEPSNLPIVHWSSHFYGPVGNMSNRYNCNNTCFNDKTWLADNNATLHGYVIHVDDYVNSLQTIGKKVDLKDNVDNVQEIYSETQGRSIGRKVVFKLNEPDEHVTAIDVRSGAWIDAIRIHTNYKSSVLMGGKGGCMSHFEPSEGQRIVGLFGRAGDYVGSLGIFVESSNSAVDTNITDENLIIVAPNGLRLIELHDKKYGEVYRHWEFLEPSPPTRFTLNRDEIIEQQARIVVIDDKGNMHSSGPFCDLNEIFSTSEASETQSALENANNDEELEKSRTLTSKDIESAVECTGYERKANETHIEGSKDQETTKHRENVNVQNIFEESDKERSKLDKRSHTDIMGETESNLTDVKSSGEIFRKDEQNLQICKSDEVEIDLKKDLTQDEADNGRDVCDQNIKSIKSGEDEIELRKGTTQDNEIVLDEGDVSETRDENRTTVEKVTIAQNELAEAELHRAKQRPANLRKGEETVTRYY